MIEKFESLLGRGRTRSVSILASGTVIGQAAVVMSSPLITRLYTPEDLGAFAIFGAALGITAALASLHYELAIPLPEKDDDAYNLALLSGMVVVVLAAFMLPLTLNSDTIVSLLHVETLSDYFWLLPITFIVYGLVQVLTAWTIRKKLFTVSAKAKAAQGVMQVMPQIALGFAHVGVIGLLIGQLIGQFVSLALLVKNLKLRLPKSHGARFPEIKRLAYEYRRFPLYTSWSSLINVLCVQAPVMLLAYFFGATAAGFYALGSRVLQMPMRLIGQSISQVYFSIAADSHRDGTLSANTFHIHEKLVRLFMPVTIILAMIAPELFSIAFGPAWREAGVYSQLVIPWLLIGSVTGALGGLVSVLQQQTLELIFQVGYLGIVVASFLLGGFWGSVEWTLGLLGGLGGAYMLIKLAWFMKLTGNSLPKTVLVWATEALIVLPAIALLLGLKVNQVALPVVCGAGALCLAIVLYTNFRIRRYSQAP